MDKSVVDFINSHSELIEEGDIQKIYDEANYDIFSEIILALLDAGCDLDGGEDKEDNLTYTLTSITREIVVLKETNEMLPFKHYIDDVTEYRAHIDENSVHFLTLKAAIDFLYELHKQGMYDMKKWYPTMTTLNGNTLVDVTTDQGIVLMIERGYNKLISSK